MRRYGPGLVAFLVTAGCLAVFWSYATPHLCYPRYWHPGDAGHGVYNAWQVTAGRVLYRDIFEYRFPLFFFLMGPLLRATGHSLLVLQAATILPLAACAPFLSSMIRRLGGGPVFAALGPPLPVLLAFAVWPFPYPPWLAWFFAAACIWALARALDEPRIDRGWLVRAGVLAALYGLTLQAHGVPFAIGATLMLAVCARGSRIATAGWFALGGLVTLVPFFVYFAAAGALGDLWWNTFVWPTKHYYNGAIVGDGLFAGVREHFARRGWCQIGGAGSPLARLYDGSVLGLSVVPTLGAVAALITLVRVGLQMARRGPIGKGDVFMAALAGGALLAFGPNLRPQMSDNAHLAMAALTPIALLLALAALHGRVWRALIVLGTLALCVVHVDRALRYQPFQKRYLDFDAHIARYWRVEMLAALSEPGDTIVHAPYGGWEYLLSGRESGIPHTWLFADYRFLPQKEMARAAAVIRERRPVLLVFKEKRVEDFLFREDPSLRERYFWNGVGWELRGLPHRKLAPAYLATACGGGRFVLEQDGNRLGGGGLAGSVRGTRVYFAVDGEQFLGQLQADGSLAGKRNGHSCLLTPDGTPPAR